MAALFYLPRLFVYHAEHRNTIGFVDVSKIMQRKLYYFIGVPAFWATLLSGLWLIYLNPTLFQTGGWLHAKLTFAFLLIIFFFYLGVLRKRLHADDCEKSGKFFRIINEIPTVLMIGIVAMVIVKPF
jgi:putative membrane protein